ncbi:hypothetical protein GGR32_000759 [Mesonia hippocampi]|uniref:DUF4843 domain-containing protein n=1 Tax=Mesonia hippocampi TaxID=1628250 RepID=A0A840EN04_9FLAO|nr:hypothetical protein [Mesonia hippocampi]MBB4118485.1 hypothetical protein [Mesonia hippocampi]
MKAIKLSQKHIQGVALFTMFFMLFSCSKEQIEKFDDPFVHIMKGNQSRIEVNTQRRDVVSYYFYYSTKNNNKDLEVTYSVKTGNGLQQGRDFDLLTTENPLLFPSGIYKRPIQIQWLNRTVEDDEDNTLTITIEQTNLKEVNIGLPGPNHYQSEFIIEKKN